MPDFSENRLAPALFQPLVAASPRIRFLTMHQVADPKCRLVYDGKAQAFLNTSGFSTLTPSPGSPRRKTAKAARAEAPSP